ncbi:MAG TPA: CstA-like transporter-associated (seleno)protein [Terriglobia bacterium]|nr:CstA-like transporter-associated (seleno)protein [Terriglobia bacterium]
MFDRVNFGSAARRLLYGLWQYLQEVSGQRDYARYRARTLMEGEKLLTPREFYQKQQEHKYSRPNRCC